VSDICCRTSVYPLDPNTAAAILTIGQFRPVYRLPLDSDIALTWERVVAEEGTTVTVSLAADSFDLSISPPISAFAHHIGKRITAGIYFEVAAKYAEKVGGEILQRATVVGCKAAEQGPGLLIARYPSLPMGFDRVCAGFQTVLLEGLNGNYEGPAVA
jgi:hypothetical protein